MPKKKDSSSSTTTSTNKRKSEETVPKSTSSSSKKQKSTTTTPPTTSPSQIILRNIPDKNEKTLESPLEVVVDITPSKNILLKAGTSDYKYVSSQNFSNAVAEFIDNSIQAVRNNPPGQRIIRITIKKPVNDNTTISFWDNGCGMNKDELQRWATMGKSQADIAAEVENPVDVVNNPEDNTITGMISRFGVGGKKAAFYLVSGNKWINQAKISLDILSSTGDQEWKIPISVREPNTSERANEQFTEVVISNVKIKNESFDEIILSLKRDLAHIYYYYLHELPRHSPYHLDDPISNNNNKEDSSSEDEDEEMVDEEEGSTSTKKSKKSSQPANGVPSANGYVILLNGQNLTAINDSMESQYLQKGKKLKIFHFKVSPKEGVISDVECHLRYFPFIMGEETLPIPYKVLKDYSDIDQNMCPLSIRKPGFEIFWNGRLISEAHIERLSFMSIGKIDGEKLEEKWVQRVKGALFLTSDFPVTHNKMHIIKESPVFGLLDKAGSRNNNTEWKKWLLSCHKLDQDFQFEAHQYERHTNRTLCSKISFGGRTFKPEDAVSLNNRPVVHGLIKSIYFHGTPEARNSDFFFEIDKLSYKKMPLEVYPGSKVKSKIPLNEYQAMLDAQRCKVPGKLKLFEGDKVSLPKNTYLSGEKIRWISVALYDKSHPPKEVEKKVLEAENVKITFTIYFEDQVTYRTETSVFYSNSRVSFKDIDVLQKTGAYRFEFSCSYPDVTVASHYVTVKPGTAHSISGEYVFSQVEQKKVQIGEPFPPLVISQLDESENKVEFPSNPKNVVLSAYLKDSSSSQASQQKREIHLSKPESMEIEDGCLVVSGLKIPSADLNDELEQDLIITCSIGGLFCEFPTISLTAGKPDSMTFSDNNIFDCDEGHMNLTFLPDFYIFLQDKDGNICHFTKEVAKPSQKPKGRGKSTQSSVATEQYYIIIQSTIFEEPLYFVSQGQEGGAFSLTTSNLSIPGLTSRSGARKKNNPLPVGLLIKEKITLPMEDETTTTTTNTRKRKQASPHSIVPVQFSLFNGKEEILTIEKNIKILPSERPAHLKLFHLSDAVIPDQREDSYKVLAGTEVKFGVKVYSAGGGGRGPFELSQIKATLSANWHTGTEQVQTDSANMITLPALNTDKSTKTVKYFAELAVENNMEKNGDPILLKKEFSVTTTGGTPSTFFLQLGKGSTAKIRCDSEVIFDVGLLDKKRNSVSPSDMRSSLPIEPMFVLTETGENRSSIPYSIKSQQIGEFNEDKGVYVCKLAIVGYGELILKVIDKNNQINESSLKVNIIEGAASMIQVNGMPKISIPCSGGEFLEELTVNICDSQGNVTKNVTGVETQFEWVGLQGPPPFEIKNKLKIEKGVGKIRNIEIGSNVEQGSYQLNVVSKGLTIQPASIFFIVKGKFSLKLLTGIPPVTPSSILPSFKVMLLNPEREPVEVEKETMKLTFHLKTYQCSEVIDKTVFIFKDIKCPRKAGEYSMNFIHTNRGTLKIELQETLVVAPDVPTRLEMVGTINTDVSTTVGKSIIIFASDSFGNKVRVKGSIAAKIEVSQNNPHPIDQITLPELSDQSEIPFNEQGDAIFDVIKLRESMGTSGPYTICFYSTNISSLVPLKQEFFFKNAKEIIDKKVSLQQNRVSLSTEISDIMKELGELNKEKANLASKYDQVRIECNEVSAKIKSFIPEFDTISTSPDDVRNLITNFGSHLESFSQSPRRQPSYPLNPTSREMADIGRSEGEGSGIVGIVNQIICLEDEKEAFAAAKICAKKIEGVVINNKQKFDQYYHKYKDSPSPTFFISLDNITPYHNRFENNNNSQQQSNLLPLKPHDGAPLSGFVGFVTNRVTLREKHEHLRKTLVWNIFRDAIMFQTLSEAMAYRQYCVTKKLHCPPILCIQEGEVLETSGFVEIGKKNKNNLNKLPQFGQIPVQETKDYQTINHQKLLLEDYKKLKHKLYLERKSEYGPQLKTINERIDYLESQKLKKQSSLNSIVNEINSLELSSSQYSQK
eukprot:gene8435-10360_t